MQKSSYRLCNALLVLQPVSLASTFCKQTLKSSDTLGNITLKVGCKQGIINYTRAETIAKEFKFAKLLQEQRYKRPSSTIEEVL